MPTPTLSLDEAERTRKAVMDALEAGYLTRGLIAKQGQKTAIHAAAEALGMSEKTLATRLHRDGAMKRIYGIEIPWSDFLPKGSSVIEPNEPEDDTPPPVVSPALLKPRAVAGKSGESTRVVAIGDTHDSPHIPDKSRFKWIARHIGETRPDRVVQIGDFASFDSVSAHDAPGTHNFALRPSFRNDLDSCEEAMCLFYKELGDSGIPCELTAGNHEDRISRYENSKPETVGALYMQFEDLCARYRWRLHDYGRFLFVDGVAFTHTPFTMAGRPYSGKHPENAIGNDAVFSMVWGHTHKAGFKRIAKIGPAQCVELLNLGSAMPDGHVERYAKLSTTGWTYAIFDLEIRAGHIVGHREISMRQLEEMYGD